MIKFNKRKVLVAPLDWGLGHATRCVPLVRTFLRMEWQVVIAAAGETEYLLQQEFPDLQFLKLPGYNVKYTRNSMMLPLKIGAQVPRILSVIRKEQLWLEKIVALHGIDLVISDNRYGLYTDKVPCVFITHQLNIKAPYRWMEKKLRQLNYNYISRFTECWIPDNEMNGLAGDLSHPRELHPFPIRYIGPLSRFKRGMAPVKYKFLFLVSGPEPQRTLFEQKILAGIGSIDDAALLVRGKPGSTDKIDVSQHVTVINHLEGFELEKAMNSSEFVVSRAGYTTIMEIAALEKKAILVPTPGQTEQQYLGAYLAKKKLAFSVSQKAFDLRSVVQQAEQFSYQAFDTAPGLHEEMVREFVSIYFSNQPEGSFVSA